MKCVICGKAFTGRHSNQKNCSRPCSKEWAKRQHREWESKNRDKVAGYREKGRARKREYAREVRVKKGLNIKDFESILICPQCGEPFKQNPNTKAVKKYCTVVCCKRAHKVAEYIFNKEALKPETRKRNRKMYWERKALGLCTKCGDKIEHGSLCDYHKQAHAQSRA